MRKEHFMFRVLVLLAALVTMPVHAELYKWTDADGRVHFTDKKPEDASHKVETLNAPRVTGPGGRRTEETPAAGSGGGDVLQRQKRMADILAQEREQQEQEAAKKQADTAGRKRQCLEMRDYRRNVDGSRLYNINEKGERVFMDDKQISQHMRELDQAIQAACQ